VERNLETNAGAGFGLNCDAVAHVKEIANGNDGENHHIRDAERDAPCKGRHIFGLSHNGEQQSMTAIPPLQQQTHHRHAMKFRYQATTHQYTESRVTSMRC